MGSLLYLLLSVIIRNDRFFFQITGNAAAINKTNAVPSIRNSAPNKNTKYKIALIKGSTIAGISVGFLPAGCTRETYVLT
ncbi:hypothetical protein ACT4US_36280, partial [Bacillus sp. HC-Mk]